LLNLVTNAVAAMPQGGVVTIETDNFHVAEDDQRLELMRGDYVRVVVSDTGLGMTPEIARHAFEPFFTTKGVDKGTGLGLAQVYGFAKQSGGSVSLDSEPNVGTRLAIYLPAVMQPSEIATPTPHPEDAQVQRRVMVVNNDPEMRRTLVPMLEQLGYATWEAKSGPDALARLDRGQRIDIVITDNAMDGGMSGDRFAGLVSTRHPHIKIVMIAGRPHANVPAGYRIVPKPFTIDDIRRALTLTLEH
jgi:CheY-like chemotaxis protein